MELLLKIIIFAVPILTAITLHEASHGWVAFKLGDPTAKALGRITVNPIKHIDPVGTILIPIVMVIATGFAFGYAKPVPVDVRNFKHPQKDMALVALAGPVSNFIMAFFWAFVLMVTTTSLAPGTFASVLLNMAEVGVIINVLLMVVNLFPMPPLDGGRIVTGILPIKWAMIYVRFEKVGMWIVVFLLVSGILGKMLMPMVQAVQKNLYAIFGLS